MDTTILPVSNLETCDRTRVRKRKPSIDSDVVIEYAEAYLSGLIVEPLDVFKEAGTERYIIADGEHRLLALRRAKIESVACRLHEGDEVEALDFALGCNRAHGVRRTKDDIYFACCRIWETPALKKKYRTDKSVSEKLGISLRTVQSYKAKWRESESTDRGAAKAKEKAKQRAEKHAPKKTLTDEQKKVAKTVRESTRPLDPPDEPLQEDLTHDGGPDEPLQEDLTHDGGPEVSQERSAQEPAGPERMSARDKINLAEFTDLVNRAARFPMSVDDAVKKFADHVDMERVIDARNFINAFLDLAMSRKE